jgi:hypothetical protein
MLDGDSVANEQIDLLGGEDPVQPTFGELRAGWQAVQTLLNVPLSDYDLVLADPPYTAEDANHYGTTMVRRNLVMRALSRLPSGAHVAWLDQAQPMWSKQYWRLDGCIGVVKSTNHRFREVLIYRRL